jgi:hypothetical protein
VNGQAVEAEFISTIGDKVILRVRQGKQLRLDISDLIQFDQDYLDSVQPPDLDIRIDKEESSSSYLKFEASIRQTNTRKYDRGLHATIMAIGEGPDGYVVLRKAGFPFKMESGEGSEVRFSMETIPIRTETSHHSNEWITYKGVVVFVEDSFENLVQVKSNKSIFEDNVSKFKDYGYAQRFDDATFKVLETPLPRQEEGPLGGLYPYGITSMPNKWKAAKLSGRTWDYSDLALSSRDIEVAVYRHYHNQRIVSVDQELSGNFSVVALVQGDQSLIGLLPVASPKGMQYVALSDGAIHEVKIFRRGGKIGFMIDGESVDGIASGSTKGDEVYYFSIQPSRSSLCEVISLKNAPMPELPLSSPKTPVQKQVPPSSVVRVGGKNDNQQGVPPVVKSAQPLSAKNMVGQTSNPNHWERRISNKKDNRWKNVILHESDIDVEARVSNPKFANQLLFKKRLNGDFTIKATCKVDGTVGLFHADGLPQGCLITKLSSSKPFEILLRRRGEILEAIVDGNKVALRINPQLQGGPLPPMQFGMKVRPGMEGEVQSLEITTP